MSDHAPISANALMRGARWAVRFRQRYSRLPYGDILELLECSSDRAGGPAMRLANALWAFDERMMFPNCLALQGREEDAFAHLWHEHRDRAKQRKYRVWQAIGLFAELRMTHFGAAMLPVAPLPPLERKDPLKRAMYQLDHSPSSPTLRKVLECMATTNPAHPAPEAHTLLLETARAACAYADWLRAGDVDAFRQFCLRVETARRLRHRHIDWVENTPVNEAITLLAWRTRQKM